MSQPPTDRDDPSEQGWAARDDAGAAAPVAPAAGTVALDEGAGREAARYGATPPSATGARPGPGGATGYPPPTNTKAIIALCTVFAVPVLGIVFGVMARREIDRTGEAGRAYATWGMGLGIAATAFWVLYFVVFLGFFALTALGALGAFGAVSTGGGPSTGPGF